MAKKYYYCKGTVIAANFSTLENGGGDIDYSRSVSINYQGNSAAVKKPLSSGSALVALYLFEHIGQLINFNDTTDGVQLGIERPSNYYNSIRDFLGEGSWIEAIPRRGVIFNPLRADFHAISEEEAFQLIGSTPDTAVTQMIGGVGNIAYRSAIKNDSASYPRERMNDALPDDPAERLSMRELEKAKHGDPESMVEIGSFYFYGICVETSMRDAAYWLKAVSEMDCEYTPIADKFIARMYYSGSIPGEEQSYEKSYEYHVRSAESDIYSASQVGYMQTVGSGCRFDYEQTEKYFLDIYDLAIIYFNPTGGFEKDFKKAQKYFQIAADMGSMEAHYVLGYMYLYGHIRKDRKKAIEHFEAAAGQGHILSAAHLAQLYTEQDHRDYDKAFSHCLFAASCGDATALYMLGSMYLFGRGCEPDADKARQCLKKASESGAPEAAILLRRIDNGMV